MKLLFKLYEGLNREGPGSPAMTRRAYKLCKGLPGKAAILELGCGSGGATIPLAKITDGTITATDVHKPFLDNLMERAGQEGVAERVASVKMDMASLDFSPASFDLIWCEGAAYIMGVDNALKYWKGFLKPGGYVAISDLVWLSPEARNAAHEDVKNYWAEEYPSMRLPEDNVSAARELGYTSVGHFTIDVSCWDTFYLDVEKRLRVVEPLFREEPDGQALIDTTRKEIEIYRAHPDMYGYEFHVFRK